MTYSILHVDASIKAEGSISQNLTRDIVAKLVAAHPGAQVTTRNLGKTPARETDANWLAAVHTPAEQRSEEQTKIAAESDALIGEIKAADTLVIGLPVYNFTVPSQLKVWLDQMARAGETFKYGENGREGLIKNTRAIVAYTAGGTKMGSDADFASGYVRFMLGFFGITDVQFVASDQVMVDPAASQIAAQDAIAALAA